MHYNCFLADFVSSDVSDVATARCHPARNCRRYTGFNLNSTRPPLTGSPSHVKKGETRIFL